VINDNGQVIGGNWFFDGTNTLDMTPPDDGVGVGIRELSPSGQVMVISKERDEMNRYCMIWKKT
jgi:hypothetical protein